MRRLTEEVRGFACGQSTVTDLVFSRPSASVTLMVRGPIVSSGMMKPMSRKYRPLWSDPADRYDPHVSSES